MAGRFLATVIHITLIGSLWALPEGSSCSGEGLQPDHESECREYFRCQGGFSTSTYSCPEGLAFNSAARQCLPRSRAPCVRHRCAPGDDSLYTAPSTQCRFYYKCERGVAIELACPTGAWFDFKKQECSRAAGVCFEPVCTGQADGRHPDTTQGCRRSLVCSGGTLAAVETGDHSAQGKCPSPRATAAAFPVAGTDRCAGLSDGPHPILATRCSDYVVCERGETKASLTCPDSYQFDGQQCSPAASTTCPDECSNREDGFHVDAVSNCRRYFYCQNHVSLFGASCPEGSAFDGSMCVSASFYTCPAATKGNPCLNRKDGFHRDFIDCRTYFFCSNEQLAYRESCPSDKVWNGRECVGSDEFHCEDPAPWPGCSDRPSGFYQDRERGSDCKSYFHCAKDLKMTFSCRPGHVFDGEECVRSETYTCPSLEKDACDFKSDGFYQQTTGGCRAYYMCSKNYKYVYLCEESHVFNGEKCVSADIYKCPFLSDECKGKSTGYHKDVKSNCRKYFFCDNEEKLTTIQCAGSKIYNGQGCVSQKDYQCPVGKDGNPCLFKSDGVYVQDGSKCRKYFKCANYKPVSQNICPPGQIFDGVSSCAVRNCAAPTVTCERDGFFPDLTTRCKSYHICIDKRKTTLHCEGKKVFNGQLCVPEDNFPCPDECSQSHCKNTV